MELKALKINYEWRVLSDNGLLEKPRKVGPYYSETSLNDFGGFPSREEAIARLEKWVTDDDKFTGEDFVLIEVFNHKR